jgi:WD40-like Beta Propeller Repeat
MRRLALAAVPVLVLALALAGGVASQTDSPTPSPEASESPSPSPSPSPEASPEPSPTAEVLPPSPPPTPLPAPNPQPAGPPRANLDPNYPGALRPGDWVQITNTDSCLNMRWEPRMPAPEPDGTVYNNVLNCLPDGFIGRLDASGWNGVNTLPANADGRWWWHIVGQGWAADEFLTFHHQGGFPWPERPDLASAGLIAFLAVDNSIWLMNADGTNQRPIVGGDPNRWVHSLEWSPAGDRLAFSTGGADGTQVTRIADLNGNIVLEFAGLSDVRWSPGGLHLSGVRRVLNSGGVIQATPVVFDLTTGAEWAVGPVTDSFGAPVWSPDGNSLAYVCVSGYTSQPDGTMVLDESRNCHGDGLRRVSIDGSNARLLIGSDSQSRWFLSAPAWSPSGETIAVSSLQDIGGCRGYALVEAASGAIVGCMAPPGEASYNRGGCGGPGMTASSWTADGRLVYSAFASGQTGLFVHSPNTGARSFIPSMSADNASLGPDNAHLTFASGNHIWVAGLDGSNLTLLAEGHSPAWQPQL